ncbi:4'-phosphopantetheinyl transferase family protein [Mucilaginibacter boryungensis]|uniref:4-phosphopantetheinyl transferase family protein n=1 Tax=Mucilaginibacter boryungensis TaxID=768480 RepID=A0ABR9XLH1_9SPHI|nr:4'-phosphopantetheinyl transferase superfamily protein [Mucilaginibacter boryungensis]MBE9668066.1 4-phosphopantetheinyl transferase family protein [Mucilaginibacter boryungensis]
MQGIGNDIIALNAIDILRTNKRAFYTKILAKSEQQLYKDSFPAIPFHLYVWLLWSVKESAYKCLQRQQTDLVFSPTGTVITNLSTPNQSIPNAADILENTDFDKDACFSSIIEFNTHKLYARSIIYGDELIHTVASTDADFNHINWGIKHIEQIDPESQSLAVRGFLLNRLKTDFPGRELAVQKHSSGYPYITIPEKQLAVSLSHHGHWVGYAYSSPSLCKA